MTISKLFGAPEKSSGVSRFAWKFVLRPGDHLIHEGMRHDSKRIEQIEENSGARGLFPCLDIADEALDVTRPFAKLALAPASFAP
jgi:hypothetical protein